jgi:hypothetical protein
MASPPDFGGRDMEEGLLEDLGGPEQDRSTYTEEEVDSGWDDNEAHAAGKVCARCGAAITAGQDARRRLDGQWVHDICPVV